MSASITLLSWNVNGIRAGYRKGFLEWLEQAQPDVLCLQETKAEADQLPWELRQPFDYHSYWNSSKRKRGYSGTGLLTKQEPLSVDFGLGIPEFDQEGRTVIAHYPSFVLINCYFPNGSRDHSRLPFKMAFYDAFLAMCEGFRAQGKQIVFCGDINTAHHEIDLANPKSNHKTTGFLPEERAWLDQVAETGYVDTYRQRNPDLTGQYTWWSMPTGARERNVGWRLDYFFVTPELMPCVLDAFIMPEVMGSDHCPVGLKLTHECQESP
ncbi:MAG: exodeoxyribonuclease III [Chloroflexi bacterium]|nr:exodeoxyribonuclease III [Chloroflexota bacterium]